MTTLIIDTDVFLAEGDRRFANLWHATTPNRNMVPNADISDKRIDIRFRDGRVYRGAAANTWQWGEAGPATITHWRLSE